MPDQCILTLACCANHRLNTAKTAGSVGCHPNTVRLFDQGAAADLRQALDTSRLSALAEQEPRAQAIINLREEMIQKYAPGALLIITGERA